jgi:hypothetical protein
MASCIVAPFGGINESLVIEFILPYRLILGIYALHCKKAGNKQQK